MTVFERATSPCKGQCSKLKKKCYRLSLFFCLLNTIMEVCDFQLCKSRAGCQAENKIYSFFFLTGIFFIFTLQLWNLLHPQSMSTAKKKPDSLQSLHERYGTHMVNFLTENRVRNLARFFTHGRMHVVITTSSNQSSVHVVITTSSNQSSVLLNRLSTKNSWSTPITEVKNEGPSQYLLFLGIERDTLLLEACLQEHKFAEMSWQYTGIWTHHHLLPHSTSSPVNSPLLHMCLVALLYNICGP